MLGIPFGSQSVSAHIYLSVTMLSFVFVCLVMLLTIRSTFEVKKYSFLIGIVVGWILYTLLFKQEQSIGTISSFSVELFPLGRPSWNIGVIVTTVIAGLLNTANTFGALKGTDTMYQSATTD